jgi:pyochelin biosynthetic protein PchC
VALHGNGWTTVFHAKADSTCRVVFFPHAGGSAGAAAPLSAAAPASVEVVTIQYPGRQWRRAEAPMTDIREMARQAAQAVLALAEKPTAIFGHSMGAIVGFEATRILEAANPGLVTRLFASGSSAPARPRRLQLSEGASDDELIDELRQMGGTGETFFADREAVKLILPALRDDYRAMSAYSGELGARISSPITAMLGQQDPATTYGQAAEWREHTLGSFEVRTFPGGHFYLNQCMPDVVGTVLAHFDLLAGVQPAARDRDH